MKKEYLTPKIVEIKFDNSETLLAGSDSTTKKIEFSPEEADNDYEVL